MPKQQYLQIQERQQYTSLYGGWWEPGIAVNGDETSTLQVSCRIGLMDIHRANYGVGPSCYKNVTTLVKGNCNQKASCSLKVTNDALGDDPCPGKRKNLDVYYFCEKPEFFG